MKNRKRLLVQISRDFGHFRCTVRCFLHWFQCFQRRASWNPYCIRTRMTTAWSFGLNSLGMPPSFGPALISWHNFQWLWCLVSLVDGVLLSNVHLQFKASALECGAGREASHFFPKGIILRTRTCLEKDVNESSCLICACSCCKTSCVGVQSYTLEFCQIRKSFYLHAYFAGRVLYLHYVRKFTHCRSVLTKRHRLRLGHSVRTDLRLVHYPITTNTTATTARTTLEQEQEQ